MFGNGAARPVQRRRPSASRGRRFASALIDAGVFIIVLVSGTLLLGDPSDPIPMAELVTQAAVVAQLLFEMFGRSIGKFVTRIEVVDFDGNRPSMRRILARSLYKSRVLVNAYSLLREIRPRHDRLAGTRVVSSV